MLRGMKSIFGAIKNKVGKKPKDAEEVVEERAKEREKKAGTGAVAGAGAGAGAGTGAGAPASGAVAGGKGQQQQRQMGPPQSTASAEEDALLDAISANVSRIGAIGQAMGSELDRQDKMLDNLSSSVDRANVKVKDNAKKARQMAK